MVVDLNSQENVQNLNIISWWNLVLAGQFIAIPIWYRDKMGEMTFKENDTMNKMKLTTLEFGLSILLIATTTGTKKEMQEKRINFGSRQKLVM